MDKDLRYAGMKKASWRKPLQLKASKDQESAIFNTGRGTWEANES